MKLQTVGFAALSTFSVLLGISAGRRLGSGNVSMSSLRREVDEVLFDHDQGVRVSPPALLTALGLVMDCADVPGGLRDRAEQLVVLADEHRRLDVMNTIELLRRVSALQT